MKASLEPTSEKFTVHANGQSMDTRIWVGRTEGGVEIEAYVVSIVPKHTLDATRLKSELPPFMNPSWKSLAMDFDKYAKPGPVDLSAQLAERRADIRAQNLHETGSETGENGTPI